MKKVRLLDYLCEAYPQAARDSHFSSILCGDVRVDSSVIRDPKHVVTGKEDIRIVSEKYVSRGAYKLKTALDAWKIDVTDMVMLDAGASTGGFTGLLLSRGAAAVYSVDVGYNQLDYSLRVDSRVTVMEKTNIMDIPFLDPAPQGAVADLSFRSIKGAAEKIIGLTKDEWCIALVKPQFEIETPYPGFDGVIRDRDRLYGILTDTVDTLKQSGLSPVRLIPSSIKGAKGNQEFLVLIDQKGTWFDCEEADLVGKAVDMSVLGPDI